MKRRTKSFAPRGIDIYDGEFSRRAPIFRKAAQHFESIFGFLIKFKNLVFGFLIKFKNLVCYFCVAKVMFFFEINKKVAPKFELKLKSWSNAVETSSHQSLTPTVARNQRPCWGMRLVFMPLRL